MDPNAIDERYVAAAALALDLALPAGHLGAVTENLRRIAIVATPVLDVPLGAEEEIAPVWRP